MGYTEAEGSAREGKLGQEEDNKEGLEQLFHSTVMYGKMHQDVRRLTSHGGIGCLLP